MIEDPLDVLNVDNSHSREHLTERVDWNTTVLDLDILQVAQLESSKERDDFLLGDLSTAIGTLRSNYEKRLILTFDMST